MSAFTPQSTAATLYYMVHSTLAGALLFLVADLARTRGAEVFSAANRPRLAGVLAVLFMASAIATAGLPPLSGFIGKLMVLQSAPGPMVLVWAVILLGSFLAILGFARAGSTLFWAPEGDAAPLPATQTLAPAVLLAALVALTVLAGPVQAWLADTAAALHNPAPYILSNQLPGGA
jgi:multicomponent K+:H+ antiporter subunit D